jgi:tRNA isopentenyl-2-thiomethyl-A-37 hydroxylase MiaE
MKSLKDFIYESIETPQVETPTIEENFQKWCDEIIESEKIESQEALDTYLKENINNFYEKFELSEEDRDDEKLLKLAEDKF